VAAHVGDVASRGVAGRVDRHLHLAARSADAHHVGALRAEKIDVVGENAREVARRLVQVIASRAKGAGEPRAVARAMLRRQRRDGMVDDRIGERGLQLVRRGVELRLFPGTAQELRLLSVHLKYVCARESLDSSRASCGELSRQVPVLERWIDAQAADHRPFAVLGDFNRDLRREPAGPSIWAEIDDANPPDADLVNTAEGQAFQNCMNSQTFSGYIDYIILGRQMAQGLVGGSFGRELFPPKDAQRRKLSDHCPVFIRLRVADAVRVAG